MNNINDKICELIDETIRSHHHVYLMTDWHLFTIYKGERHSTTFEDHGCHERYNFDEVVNNMRKMLNNKEDLLIFLGDAVDGEFKIEDKDKLRSLLKDIIKCKGIYVLGNNDEFDADFYKSCDFSYVVDSFVWSNILFSHKPISDNDCDMNIHGHIHDNRRYYEPYTNQIDVAYCGGRVKPVELMTVIKTQKSYKDIISSVSESVINQIPGLYNIIREYCSSHDVTDFT